VIRKLNLNICVSSVLIDVSMYSLEAQILFNASLSVFVRVAAYIEFKPAGEQFDLFPVCCCLFHSVMRLPASARPL